MANARACPAALSNKANKVCSPPKGTFTCRHHQTASCSLRSGDHLHRADTKQEGSWRRGWGPHPLDRQKFSSQHFRTMNYQKYTRGFLASLRVLHAHLMRGNVTMVYYINKQLGESCFCDTEAQNYCCLTSSSGKMPYHLLLYSIFLADTLRREALLDHSWGKSFIYLCGVSGCMPSPKQLVASCTSREC